MLPFKGQISFFNDLMTLNFKILITMKHRINLVKTVCCPKKFTGLFQLLCIIIGSKSSETVTISPSRIGVEGNYIAVVKKHSWRKIFLGRSYTQHKRFSDNACQ